MAVRSVRLMTTRRDAYTRLSPSMKTRSASTPAVSGAELDESCWTRCMCGRPVAVIWARVRIPG